MNQREKTRNLAQTALLVGLILILGFTPIGMIPMPGITLSLLALPVVIGTLMLGIKRGMVLGFSFATVSALKALGINGAPSALVATLMEGHVALAMIMSFAPRLLVPVITHAIYRAFAHGQEKSLAAVPAAAIAGSLTNTVFYLGLMLLFYVLTGLDTKAVLAVIAGTGVLAGGCEAAACALIATPVLAALWKVKRERDAPSHTKRQMQ